MSAIPGEFEGIFLYGSEQRPVMSRPPMPQASDKLIGMVRDGLDIEDLDQARETADWIAALLERFGASCAQPVLDTDGAGPVCSYCGQIWPLCGHHHLSEMLS